jgi:hypothetical protein
MVALPWKLLAMEAQAIGSLELPPQAASSRAERGNSRSFTGHLS